MEKLKQVSLNIIKNLGLSDDEQEELRDNHADCMKLEKRDLGMCLMTKKYGATTLSLAISLAHVAGISVVATQAIGGVGPINNYNLSADVMELGKTPVAVVCSGTIFDAAKTMEVLETQGVNVCATNLDNLAGVCKVDSGIKANLRCDDVEELSRYIFTQFTLLGLKTGYVVSNPVIDSCCTNAGKADLFMKDILESANDKIPFRDLKLWMFNKLDELSEGKACVSLKSILVQNSILASRIASNLCEMSQNDDGYWNTDLYKQSHIIAKNPQVFGNMPMHFNKSPQKLQSPTKGKKIQALQNTTISLDQLHVNKGRSPFEDSLYNKPVDGSAEDQMLKLQGELHVCKIHHKNFADHDEHEKERMDHCAHWGSKRAV